MVPAKISSPHTAREVLLGYHCFPFQQPLRPAGKRERGKLAEAPTEEQSTGVQCCLVPELGHIGSTLSRNRIVCCSFHFLVNRKYRGPRENTGLTSFSTSRCSSWSSSSNEQQCSVVVYGQNKSPPAVWASFNISTPGACQWGISGAAAAWVAARATCWLLRRPRSSASVVSDSDIICKYQGFSP